MEGFLEETLAEPCLPQGGVEGHKEKREWRWRGSGIRTGVAKPMQCGSSTMGRGMGSRRTQERWGGRLNRLECHPTESGEP